MRKSLFRKVALVIFIIGVLVVIWFSLAPGDPIGSGLSDKLEHLLAYAALAACSTQAFEQGRTKLTSYVGLIALGCVLEGLQAYIPGRHPSVADGVANAAGIMVGVLLSWMVARAFGLKKSNFSTHP